MKTFFQNLDLFKVASRRKLHLGAVFVSAGILAAVFSSDLFITPKYRSSAFVYPVNIIPYSMETPTEQLLQLFGSADVRAMMIRKFRLGDHYGIDTAAVNGKSRLFLKYEENIVVKKTEYESVKIEILDEDPRTASEMVNELIHFVDVKARMVQREKTAEVVKIYSDQLSHKRRQMDSVDKVLGDLRVRYGLLDYKTQSKEVTKSYLKLASNNSSLSQYRGVDTLYRHLQHKGGDFLALSSQYKALLDDYNLIKTNYDQAVIDLNKELTYTNVISRPYPSDSKAYPVRWVIVLISVFSATLLALVVFVIADRNKI